MTTETQQKIFEMAREIKDLSNDALFVRPDERYAALGNILRVAESIQSLAKPESGMEDKKPESLSDKAVKDIIKKIKEGYS